MQKYARRKLVTVIYAMTRSTEKIRIKYRLAFANEAAEMKYALCLIHRAVNCH